MIGTFLLREFAQVCEELDLRFFLDGGTMLGSLRDGRWIPWDDDIDVLMFRADFELLRQEAAGAFDWPVRFSDPLSDPNHATVLPRLVYEPSGLDWSEALGIRPADRQHLALDIFILDRVPRSKIVRRVWYRWLRAIQAVHVMRATTVYRILDSSAGALSKAGALAARGAAVILPVRLVSKAYDISVKAFRRSGSGLVSILNTSTNWRGMLLDERILGSEAYGVHFEGHRYLVPGGDSVARMKYGSEFMQPPPEAQRRAHGFKGLWVEFADSRWPGQASVDMG